LRAFSGHIHINDPAVCRFQIHLIDCEHFRSKGQSRLLRTIIGS
jgi:hypothetical protein